MTEKKTKIIDVNQKEYNKMETFIEENKELVNQKANEVAREMGYKGAKSLVEEVNNLAQSPNSLYQQKAGNLSGEFATKLSGVLFDQVIYTKYASESLLGWYTKFLAINQTFGNNIEFYDNVATGCTIYDRSKYWPEEFTDSLVDKFSGGFLKADNTDSVTAYRFKKNKSVSAELWLPFFLSGKLSTMIAAILTDLMKGFQFFITYYFQQTIKKLASGTAQTTIANAGENGSALRLKKFEDTTSTNTFEALITFFQHYNELLNDFNKTTIATDSRSLFSPTKDDLVIFIPQKLKNIIQTGIMSRLPSASYVNFNELLGGENVITVTKALKDPQKKAPGDNATEKGNTAAIDIETTPYLPEDTIVVLEKRAIQHFIITKQGGQSFFPENLITEYVQHAWGYTVILPFAKGFVYKCNNLLNYKAA